MFNFLIISHYLAQGEWKVYKVKHKCPIMGFAELAKKTMTKHCVKVPGDESVYLSTPKHIWSFFKLSLREHALFCTTVRHASNVWRYFFGDSISGVTSCNTGWHTWSKSQYCPSLKVLQVKTSCFNAHFNSVYKEKVLLGSLIQTSPNVAHVSGDHALIVPAGAATPPHCDNPLHSSSCLKLRPCPFNVSCLAVQSSGSVQWLMNLELNYSTKLTTGRSQAGAPETVLLQVNHPPNSVLSMALGYGSVSPWDVLYLDIQTHVK